MTFYRFAALTAGVITLAAASSASASCTIYQNPGYAGSHHVVGANTYVRFDGNAPARSMPTTDNYWWHNRVSAVKMPGNCKAVFFGSHGSQYGHFVINKSGNLPRGQADLSQGVICECSGY